MKIVNQQIFLQTFVFVNHNILIHISGLTANVVFIYAYPLISFCIDNLCYLPKLFNTALYEFGLGDSYTLDHVLWRNLPNSTFT